MPAKSWKRRIAVEWLILISILLVGTIGTSIVFAIRSYHYQREKNAFIGEYLTVDELAFDPDLYLAQSELKEGKTIVQLSAKQREALNRKKKMDEAKEQYEDYVNDFSKPEYLNDLSVTLIFVPIAWLGLLIIRITIWSIRTIKNSTVHGQ